MGLFLNCCNHKESDPENSCLEEWEQFNTELIKEEKSSQKYEEIENERKNILYLRQTEVFLPKSIYILRNNL